MNILFDRQIFSQQPYGVISRCFYEIANFIAAVEGNEVEIFAPGVALIALGSERAYNRSENK